MKKKCAYDWNRLCNDDCVAYIKVGVKSEVVHCLRMGKDIKT